MAAEVRRAAEDEAERERLEAEAAKKKKKKDEERAKKAARKTAGKAAAGAGGLLAAAAEEEAGMADAVCMPDPMGSPFLIRTP